MHINNVKQMLTKPREKLKAQLVMYAADHLVELLITAWANSVYYHDEWLKAVKEIESSRRPAPRALQSQAALNDQLLQLMSIADRAGLYDASDFIRDRIKTK